MKALLKRAAFTTYYYDNNGIRHEGAPEYIRGDLTDIWGDLTDIWGNLTGIRGNLTGIRGDLDDCEITDADRIKGIDIADLVNK